MHALQSDQIHPQHLLLALLKSESGAVWRELGGGAFDAEKLEREVMRVTPRNGALADSGLFLPYTGAAKRLLEASMQRARETGAEVIVPKHLFEAISALPVRGGGLFGLRKPSMSYLLQQAKLEEVPRREGRG